MVNGWRQFRKCRDGQTVWVIGSGRTLDWIAPAFFDDKTTIAINQAAWELGIRADFWVSNHHHVAKFLASEHPESIAVTSEVEQVPPEHRRTVDLDMPNVVTVPTIDQQYGRFNAHEHWPVDSSVLPVGPSSATLALGWAEFIGARHIVLAGVDGGAIDGHTSSASHTPAVVGHDPAHIHLGLWERALVSSAEVLRERRIQVHSLNPWVTLNLEGHTFTQ